MLVLFLAASSLTTAAQQILSVGQDFTDNVTSFSDLQSAIDAANPNDWIYVYPGNYESIVVNKPVRLTGVGYYLLDNYDIEPDRSAHATLSGLLSVESTGSGAIIESLAIGNVEITDASNVFLRRCHVGGYMNLSNTSNVIISSSYFRTSSVLYDASPYVVSGTTQALFENCVFNPAYKSCNYGCTRLYYAFGANGGTHNLVFERCIFTLSPRFVRGTGQLTFSDCIFYRQGNAVGTPSSGADYTSAYTNNISVSSRPSGGSNIDNVDHTSIFASTSNLSFDAGFQLAPDSPAKGSAGDGGDCGVFDGANPYILSGVPELPLIYRIEADRGASTQQGLPVNIKVRTQN